MSDGRRRWLPIEILRQLKPWRRCGRVVEVVRVSGGEFIWRRLRFADTADQERAMRNATHWRWHHRA